MASSDTPKTKGFNPSFIIPAHDTEIANVGAALCARPRKGLQTLPYETPPYGT